MSIHEVRFGENDKVSWNRLQDRQIQACTTPYEDPFNTTLPQISESEEISHGSIFDLNSPTRRVTIFTAVSPHEVIAEEIVTGIDIQSGYPGRIFLSRESYVKNEINDAQLRLGDRGFAWSPTPEYGVGLPTRRQALLKTYKTTATRIITSYRHIRFL